MKDRVMFRAGGAAALLLGLAAAPPGHAQSDPYPIGAGGLSASVELRATYSDNFYYQPDNREPQEVAGTVLSPAVEYTGRDGSVELDAAVGASIARFDAPGSGDDYEDALARLRLDLQPALRHRLGLNGQYQRGHDPFGTERTEAAGNIGDDLDVWDLYRGAVSYRFGAQGARINAEFELRGLRKEYVTNESQTQPLNHDTVGMAYTVFYNLGPKTALLFEASRADVTFDEQFTGTGAVGRDATDLQFMVGGRWQATGKTSGDARVGYARREFEGAGDSSRDRLAWRVGTTWAATARSTFRLETARAYLESYLADTRVLDQKWYGLGWKHQWGARIGSELSYSFGTIEFDPTARTDDNHRAEAALKYLLTRSLALNTGVIYRERSVDQAALSSRNYERTTLFAGFSYHP